MFLAKLINECEDELICDLAEVYGIYDYESLPFHQVAIYAAGLRDDSRVKMKLSGQKLTTTESLLALICDGLTFSIWRSSDKKKRGKKPDSIYLALTEPPKEKDDLKKFDTPDDFDEWYRSKMEKNNG